MCVCVCVCVHDYMCVSGMHTSFTNSHTCQVDPKVAAGLMSSLLIGPLLRKCGIFHYVNFSRDLGVPIFPSLIPLVSQHP